MTQASDDLYAILPPALQKLADIITGHCNCPYYDLNGMLCPPCAEKGCGEFVGDMEWAEEGADNG